MHAEIAELFLILLYFVPIFSLQPEHSHKKRISAHLYTLAQPQAETSSNKLNYYTSSGTAQLYMVTQLPCESAARSEDIGADFTTDPEVVQQ